MTPTAADVRRLDATEIGLIRKAVLSGPIALAVKVMAKHVMGLVLSPGHHRLLDHLGAGRHRAAFMYRNFGKSVTWTVPRLLVEIVRDAEARILITSRTDVMAEGFSIMAQQHVEQNDMFERCFGDLRGPRWSSKYWTTSSREGVHVEPTVSVVGVQGSVVSRHYTLILGDDLVDDKNSRTAGQRSRMKLWWDTALFPTLMEGAPIYVVGTRYHPQDLYEKLSKDFEKYERNEGRSGAALALPAVSEKEWGEAMVPWPERHSYDWMMNRKEGMLPQVWAGQYQQDTAQMGGKVFRPEWIEPQEFDRHEMPRNPAMVILTADVMSEEREVTEDSSYFAMVLMAVDRQGDGWIVDAYREKGKTFDEQIDKIVEWARRGVTWVGLEEVHAQKWARQHLTAKHGIRNIIPLDPKKMGGDKVQRAMLHSAPFAQSNRLHIRSDLYELKDELIMFDGSPPNDLVDCVTMAVWITTQFDVRAASSASTLGSGRSSALTAGRDDDEPGILDREF